MHSDCSECAKFAAELAEIGSIRQGQTEAEKAEAKKKQKTKSKIEKERSAHWLDPAFRKTHDDSMTMTNWWTKWGKRVIETIRPYYLARDLINLPSIQERQLSGRVMHPARLPSDKGNAALVHKRVDEIWLKEHGGPQVGDFIATRSGDPRYPVWFGRVARVDESITRAYPPKKNRNEAAPPIPKAKKAKKSAQPDAVSLEPPAKRPRIEAAAAASNLSMSHVELFDEPCQAAAAATTAEPVFKEQSTRGKSGRARAEERLNDMFDQIAHPDDNLAESQQGTMTVHWFQYVMTPYMKAIQPDADKRMNDDDRWGWSETRWRQIAAHLGCAQEFHTAMTVNNHHKKLVSKGDCQGGFFHPLPQSLYDLWKDVWFAPLRAPEIGWSTNTTVLADCILWGDKALTEQTQRSEGTTEKMGSFRPTAITWKKLVEDVCEKSDRRNNNVREVLAHQILPKNVQDEANRISPNVEPLPDSIIARLPKPRPASKKRKKPSEKSESESDSSEEEFEQVEAPGRGRRRDVNDDDDNNGGVEEEDDTEGAAAPAGHAAAASSWSKSNSAGRQSKKSKPPSNKPSSQSNGKSSASKPSKAAVSGAHPSTSASSSSPAEPSTRTSKRKR